MTRFRVPVTGDFGGALTARIGRRFAAGPTVDDALRRAADLLSAGPAALAPRVTVEYVAHPARSTSDADDAFDVLSGLLSRAGAGGLAADAAVDLVVPLPVLGSGAPAEERLGRLSDSAAAVGTLITVGPHHHSDADAVLDVVSRLRPLHPDLGVEVWSALRRTAADVQGILADPAPAPPRVLLRRGGGDSGRGGRAVPGAVGLPTPTDADRAFVRYAKRLLNGVARPTFAPGDATLTGIVEALADASPDQPPDQPWELQMELGRRHEDVQRLLAAGRRVRVAVPFGPRWRAVGLRRSVSGSGLVR